MISPAELTALLVAITGLVAALGVLYTQVRSLAKRVDGRLTELLDLTRESARAEGALHAGMPDQTASAAVPELRRAHDAEPPTRIAGDP